MKRLIINADDLGISVGTNDAIRHAHEHGLLTSSSLLANGPAFDHAVEHVVRQCPDLGVGLHFNLTSGPACAPPESLGRLVHDDGRFAQSFLGLTRLSIRESLFSDWVALEFEQQRKRLHDAQVEISHVDGHQHVQMVPAIFRIINRLCREQGCSRIRISHEPMRRAVALGSISNICRRLKNFPKKVVLDGLGIFRCKSTLQAPDRVFGIIDSGHVGEKELVKILSSLQRGVTEVITHPSQEKSSADESVMSQSDISFLGSPNRLMEYNSLLSKRVLQLVKNRNIQLVNYHNAFL